MPANLTTRFRSEALRHRWLTLLALVLFTSMASDARLRRRVKFGSYDRDFIRQCEQSIQSLSFFEPAEAREIAGPDSRPVLAEHP